MFTDEKEIEEDTRFVDLGLDSILATGLIKRINEVLLLDLPVSCLYSYSSTKELRDYIVSQVKKDGLNEKKIAKIFIEEPHFDSEKEVNASEEIINIVKKSLSAVLYINESEIDEDARWSDLGLDSILTVDFGRKISVEFDIDFQVSLLYNYSCVRALSEYLSTKSKAQMSSSNKSKLKVSNPINDRVASHVSLSDKKSITDKKITLITDIPGKQVKKTQLNLTNKKGPLASIKLKEKNPSMIQDNLYGSSLDNKKEDIAVIGISARFPKANNVETFWQNIVNGKDCVEKLSDKNTRLNSDCSNARWMGILEDADKFDPLFFNISPKEAMMMDPQQRVFLEACWHAIEDSGYTENELSNIKCGVFVGVSQGGYDKLLIDAQADLNAQLLIGNTPSILSARIAYFLNLKGASLAIDTACSSSLVAIHEACRSLISGDHDMMLAGGMHF